MEDEMNTGKAGKLPPQTLALMVVVAVITIIAVWMVPVDEEAESPSLPELPGTSTADGDLPPLVDRSATAQAGDRARTFIANSRTDGAEPDPEKVFVEAQRLQEEGHSVDAYLLYRFAARHGHGLAAMILGSQADAAADTDSPNDEPEQAYKWYSMAAAAGVEEAATRLQTLRTRVEQSAADGDERAQRLMLQWQ
jgi:TPR repeat protein